MVIDVFYPSAAQDVLEKEMAVYARHYKSHLGNLKHDVTYL